MNISHWTGLTGLDLKNLERWMDEQGLDFEQGYDWKTIGEDMARRDYESAVEQLQKMYGYTKPMSQDELKQSVDKGEQEEAESLMNTKEGVKELLRRVYNDPTIPRKKIEYYKNLLLETNPAGIATAIALYDGDSKAFAKRFLGEEVIPMTTPEVKKIMEQKKFVRLISSGGYITTIDGRHLDQPVKATDFVSEADECRVLPGSGEKVAVGKNPDGTIKWGYSQIYQCKREPPAVLKPIDINLKVDRDELEKGIIVEKEHTEDYDTARKIALHHLAENKYYYTYLDKMEKEMAEAERTVSPEVGKILQFIRDIPVPTESRREPEPIKKIGIEWVGIPSEQLNMLDQKYGSKEIMILARENRIKTGKKTDMISDLVRKGVKL